MSGAWRGGGDESLALEERLTNEASRLRIADFPRPHDDVDNPGVYAWFVDQPGATAISSGLGVVVATGLIYGGQAGAGLSSATLRSRVLNNHIRGNVTASTFRLTLAAILCGELGLTRGGGRALEGDGEQLLSRWMADHLSLAVAPVADRGRLAILEAIVLAELDPPLNLQGMVPTPVRAAVARLRRQLTTRAAIPRPIKVATGGVPMVTGSAPDMVAFLTGLVGRTIPTLTGRLNRVIAVTDENVIVGSGRSPEGCSVPLAAVQDAANRLFARGNLIIEVATVGYRSAFVGAALAALPGTRIELRPRRVVLTSQEWPPRPKLAMPDGGATPPSP